jgi:hypothetical protein
MKIKVGDRYRDYVGTIYEVYEYKNKIIKFLVDNKTFEIYTKNEFESECMGNRFHKAQLPQKEISDEEIENDAFERFITDSGRFGFISGAKWYREQIKQRQCNKQ